MRLQHKLEVKENVDTSVVLATRISLYCSCTGNILKKHHEKQAQKLYLPVHKTINCLSAGYMLISLFSGNLKM